MSKYQYNSWEPVNIKAEDLTEKEKFLLRDSKTFCIYPWMHIHAYPTGEAYPCCRGEFEHPVANTNTQTLNEIINCDKMNSLRLDIINGIERVECKKCYEQDQHGFFSGRKSANKHYGHHINKVKKDTLSDGSLAKFEMAHWDIRFSNLCNLSCRSCGHIFSSSWHKDQGRIVQDDYWNAVKGPDWPKNSPSTTEDFNKLPELVQKELREDLNSEIFEYLDYDKKVPVMTVAGGNEENMLQQVLEHSEYVEQIYFAGGEPLIMEQHYRILNQLIDSGRSKDVLLQYNSNFMKLNYKGQHVFDLWKHFKHVSVGASLDAMGPHAEYIRTGTVWSTIEKNRIDMIEQCPEVDFYISPTLSIMNAMHITDFHKDWVEKGLINPQDLNINILQYPMHYRIDIAPNHYKEKIIKKYKEHIKWLEGHDDLQRATNGFISAINFLDVNNTKYLNTFWEKTKQLDEIRNENIFDFIPELNEITT